MTIALASQLREGTKKAHTMAENTGFVSCFLKGVVDKASYRTLVADLYFVYDAMEQEIGKLRAAGHPVVGPVGFPELNRRESLEQDLAYYFGEGWRNSVKATPAAQEYVARIHQIAQESPELLVGHHYTRYIGDLSGGQILKAIAQKAMNLGEHDGLRFYAFDAIPDEKGFKANYRTTLDALPIDQATADRIVAEANHAFHLNMTMFQELEGNLIAAIGKVLFGFLTRRQRSGSTEAVLS
ncbi:heme oxygenase (biliverdin-producing) [Vulcanococcus limneticus Candia 3F8]|uniref:biliverdin-producing heme oxygenase n=1 Tax=Vulcanococcus limneticus TaxID=2170428 RepID=UPI000B98BC64|nr:heme oxygenase (biliverdin-producing) [Vulcanococcus limneticus]MCP9793176.1 heme oxygenase (biliverdin-producing) [Vulcanococcus limneticus MW73D5]MCP9895182.1 heme oxygenase (biliverdin-producing) [Vulcanococcus limneticus Candia 3F8]MCP9898574.1 heme oxygenase (biliverdin-producing) [Vulcanococcus limneticus Candia 3B3]